MSTADEDFDWEEIEAPKKGIPTLKPLEVVLTLKKSRPHTKAILRITIAVGVWQEKLKWSPATQRYTIKRGTKIMLGWVGIGPDKIGKFEARKAPRGHSITFSLGHLTQLKDKSFERYVTTNYRINTGGWLAIKLPQEWLK